MTDEGRRLDKRVLNGSGVRSSISISYINLPEQRRRLFARARHAWCLRIRALDHRPWLDVDVKTSDLLDMLVRSRLVEVLICNHSAGLVVGRSGRCFVIAGEARALPKES